MRPDMRVRTVILLYVIMILIIASPCHLEPVVASMHSVIISFLVFCLRKQ